MDRIGSLIYGLVCYLIFFATILYAIGFTINMYVPTSLDTGEGVFSWGALGINVLLLGLFAIQHTIMARPAFKQWFTKTVPAQLERSTFVVLASLLLLLLFWQWRPMSEVVWHVETPLLRGVLTGISLLGFALVFYATFAINHFDLFGLRQTWLYFRGVEYSHPGFAEPLLYQMVRNPLMLGFLIAFWAAPTMTLGHLVFSVVVSLYVPFGIFVEERDLAEYLGDEYLAYKARTPMLIPRLPREHASASATPA